VPSPEEMLLTKDDGARFGIKASDNLGRVCAAYGCMQPGDPLNVDCLPPFEAFKKASRPLPELTHSAEVFTAHISPLKTT
jgi:hypothetical protein